MKYGVQRARRGIVTKKICFSIFALLPFCLVVVGSDTEPPFKPTKSRLVRGRYLVEGVAHCFMCHSEVDQKTRLPISGKKGGGRFVKAEGRRTFDVTIPNISPDIETGAGSWKDEDFVRVLRQGIGHDGRTLITMMPYRYFRNISDDDLASIIVYVRSIAAVKNTLPKMVVPEEVAARSKPLPDPGRVPGPEMSDPVKRGQYLVGMAQCAGCHTPKVNAVPIPGMEFAGGEVLRSHSGAHNTVASANLTPAGISMVASANLTRDPSGIPYYDPDMFVKTIRAGAVNGVRQLDSAMPWAYFKSMTDSDLKAIFAFLRSLKPVTHRVDNDEPPTPCPLCGKTHGGGERNTAPAK
ncbi:MAG TPA: c-type cytochrome [Acidobacteriota bacterium]|jgi:mono/diheme cytochrome c family protein